MSIAPISSSGEWWQLITFNGRVWTAGQNGRRNERLFVRDASVFSSVHLNQMSVCLLDSLCVYTYVMMELKTKYGPCFTYVCPAPCLFYDYELYLLFWIFIVDRTRLFKDLLRRQWSVRNSFEWPLLSRDYCLVMASLKQRMNVYLGHWTHSYRKAIQLFSLDHQRIGNSVEKRRWCHLKPSKNPLPLTSCIRYSCLNFDMSNRSLAIDKCWGEDATFSPSELAKK